MWEDPGRRHSPCGMGSARSLASRSPGHPRLSPTGCVPTLGAPDTVRAPGTSCCDHGALGVCWAGRGFRPQNGDLLPDRRDPRLLGRARAALSVGLGPLLSSKGGPGTPPAPAPAHLCG